MRVGKDVEMSAVEVELDRVSEGNEKSAEVKKQQLDLFRALTKDISEPTIALVAKLNCETKCLCKKYSLLVACNTLRFFFLSECN